jgi:hypothetical protein
LKIPSLKGLAPLILLTHAALAAQGAEGTNDRLSPAGRFLEKLLPTRIHVGPEAGVLASRLTASSEYRALITPVETRRDVRAAPSYGVTAVFRWSHGFSLALAPRWESYGLETREGTVSFPDNPFPHTLKARTELSYLVLPLLAGMGWEGRRQHLRAQLGVYKATLDAGSVEWTVDDERYEGRPTVEIATEHTGWLFATEYGVRMGPGEMVLGVEAQRAFRSLMTGLEGAVRSQGGRVKLGYLWALRGG